MGPAIRVRDLRHSYSGKAPALGGVSFEVQPGEVFGLLGPNGGGKTTLSRVLCTLLKPDEGTATVDGADVAADPDRVRRAIGVVFQAESLDKHLTVRENLRHQGHLYGLCGSSLDARIDELLLKFGLADRAGDRVKNLSGGLKRRAELAKSLLHSPKVLLMDEPTTGVDPGARQEFWTHIFALREKEKITVLVTTHLMEEAERCDRVAILDRGRLVAIGAPSELKSEIGGEMVLVETSEPERLAGQIAERFKVSPEIVDGTIRVEWPKGHSFIPALVEAFPGKIRSVRLSQPSLEDVFIHRTRHGFWQAARE